MRTLLLLSVISLAFAVLHRKQLAGPPSEFESMRIPNPIVGALTEKSAFINIHLEKTPNTDAFSWSTDLPVDSSSLFTLGIFSPLQESLDFILTNPSGEVVDLASYAHESSFPIGESSVPGTVFMFENPTIGVWHLAAKSKAGRVIEPTYSLHGAVILFNESPVKAWAHLTTYHLTKGEQVGLVIRATDEESLTEGQAPRAIREIVSKAWMEVTTPDGDTFTVPMHDNGLNADGDADDGVYGALVAASETGTYVASATIEGTYDGKEFMRTTEHLLPVAKYEVDLKGSAFMTQKDHSHFTLHLDIDSSSPSVLMRAYTEVYGKNDEGNEVAVCWLSALVNPTESNTVELSLDRSWIIKAGAKAPFVLKNTFLQDAHVHVLLSSVMSMPVVMPGYVYDRIYRLPHLPNMEITEEMSVGVRPVMNVSQVEAAAPTLMLVHGYCSSTNPFKDSASSIYTNAAYFLNKDGNLNNQKFSELVDTYADSLNMNSYSIVGHSQGGMVGLHMLNYFFSGMDKPTSGRRIQSIGTPYQGCTAAGSAANLGKAFGVGCGSNTDLSVDGAKLWLSGITAASQSQVYYATTTYKQGNLFGDYCNMAINAVLEWPNDGTTELRYTTLPKGGTNLGNTQKWCHTTGMKYPAQYTSTTLNTDFNAKAAR